MVLVEWLDELINVVSLAEAYVGKKVNAELEYVEEKEKDVVEGNILDFGKNYFSNVANSKICCIVSQHVDVVSEDVGLDLDFVVGAYDFVLVVAVVGKNIEQCAKN